MTAQFLTDPTAPIEADCVADDRPIQFRLSTVGTRAYAGMSLVFLGAVALGFSGYTGVVVPGDGAVLPGMAVSGCLAGCHLC